MAQESGFHQVCYLHETLWKMANIIYINWCFPTIWDLWNLMKNGHILYITWCCCRVSEPTVGPALGNIIDMQINMKLMGFIEGLCQETYLPKHRISSNSFDSMRCHQRTLVNISKSWVKISQTDSSMISPWLTDGIGSCEIGFEQQKDAHFTGKNMHEEFPFLRVNNFTKLRIQLKWHTGCYHQIHSY